MKSNNHHLFQDLKQHHVPHCPNNLEDVVLRRIRHENVEKPLQGSGWNGTVAHFFQPRMAAIMLVFVSSTAAVTTAVASQWAAPVEVKADTLGLEAIGKPITLEMSPR